MDPPEPSTFSAASATLGGTIHPDGSGFTVDPLQRIDRDLPAKHQVRFRLLLRHGMVELYFDEILMNVYSLPNSASGRIGFLNNGSRNHGSQGVDNDAAGRGAPIFSPLTFTR